MANLILTQACNKNCAYCFARQFRFDSTTPTEMSLETVNTILDKVLADSATPYVSLLGGEPTEHSQFTEILDLCISRKVGVSIISNFLFSSDIRTMLVDRLRSGISFSFLINATELRIGNRMQVFMENYNAIYEELKNTDNSDKITCGFTLDGELLTQDGFDNYLMFLSSHLTGIERIRISLNFPGNEEDKGSYYFIKNYELGDLIYYIVRRSLSIGATPSIDCITYPCMYRSKKIRKFIEMYNNRGVRYICEGAPADYLPDGTTRYCFPCLKASVDARKYRTASSILTALKSRYVAIQKTLDTPATCSSCEFFKNKICRGPCLGFRQIP